MARALSMFVPILLLVACGAEEDAPGEPEAAGTPEGGRRLVRTAALVLVVEDPGAARVGVERIDREWEALAREVEYARIELTLRTVPGQRLLAGAFSPGTFAGDCLGILVVVLNLLGYAQIFVAIVIVPVALIGGGPALLLVTLRHRRRRLPTPPAA